MSGGFCFCIWCAPLFLVVRYGTKKWQTAQPWATPAKAIPEGNRPEAGAGRGAPAQDPPRAADPPDWDLAFCVIAPTDSSSL